jgi:hypothetical protein
MPPRAVAMPHKPTCHPVPRLLSPAPTALYSPQLANVLPTPTRLDKALLLLPAPTSRATPHNKTNQADWPSRSPPERTAPTTPAYPVPACPSRPAYPYPYVPRRHTKPRQLRTGPTRQDSTGPSSTYRADLPGLAHPATARADMSRHAEPYRCAPTGPIRVKRPAPTVRAFARLDPPCRRA